MKLEYPSGIMKLNATNKRVCADQRKGKITFEIVT